MSPRSTVFDHGKDLYPKMGAGTPTILMPQEEKEIVVILQVLQKIGIGLTKDLVRIVICDYLNIKKLKAVVGSISLFWLLGVQMVLACHHL